VILNNGDHRPNLLDIEGCERLTIRNISALNSPK